MEAIDKFESLLFGCIMLSLSFKNFLAAQTASSDPENVGIMLSNFCKKDKNFVKLKFTKVILSKQIQTCLKEAIAVKRPRTEGCKTMSGWIKTALNKGWG